MANRAIYISYYSDPEKDVCRDSVPAAVHKIDFIIRMMNAAGFKPEILSLSGAGDRKHLLKRYKGYVRRSELAEVRFFDQYDSRFRPLRVMGRMYAAFKIRRFILKSIGPGDKVVLYHSLGALHIIKALRKRGIPFVLEAEEIYSDVTGKAAMREKEMRLMRCADAFIFPTKVLDRELNTESKPAVVISGTYGSEPDRGAVKFGREPGARAIHCVYAGTFDPRKGAPVVILAAEHLPADYHVHIIGFGNEEDTSRIRRLTDEISERAAAKVTYDGLLTGEDYIRFLQRCDIGLSPQDPDAAFNATSFPSKILSYLANGLQVVSIRIPAIESSAIADQISYYDEQTPQCIAKAIMNVDVSSKKDSRELLDKLAEEFRVDLAKILDSI